MDIKYNASYKGQTYNATYGSAYYPSADGLFHNVYYVEDMEATLSGYWVQTPSGNVYLQTTAGYWILNGDSTWQKLNITRSVATYSARSAQSLVDSIIEADQRIICANLLCARFANKLTASERTRLYELQTRLQERDAALRTDGILTNVQTSYPQGYAEFGSYLDRFMQNPQGVGVAVSATAIIVVSAIVVASLATATYFWYKAYANQAKEDVKYSEELTNILTSRLTEEEYQQLLDETQGIVTKARIKQNFQTGGSMIGWTLVGLGILMVMNLWRGGSLRK